MELDPELLEKANPLAFSNTITIAALVGVLVRKGLLSHEELAREIRELRARLEAKGAPDGPG